VREFETEGTGLHFNYLGIHSQQMPTFDVRYWFNEVSALHFRFRYFVSGADHQSRAIKSLSSLCRRKSGLGAGFFALLGSIITVLNR
jgi:hypothetical protein